VSNLESVQPLLEDPLAYLPCSTILEFHNGQTIYSQDQPPKGLYLVVEGMVNVCRFAEDGRQMVVDFYVKDDFFGESAFRGLRQTERAVALKPCSLMSWTLAEIQTIIIDRRRPQLITALLQLWAQRSGELGRRIETYSFYKIPQRLARFLVDFSQRAGKKSEDGSSIIMESITHELIGQYIGTDRESVCYYMNQFRRQGLLNYWGRRPLIVRLDALKAWLVQRDG
jgi:CRP/FNR family cyclic AMP-dependent transcriptional regulator